MLSKNIKGFTLAGVMVTAGILGVLSVAFMQLTKNMNDSQRFAVSKADEIELRAAIRLLLNDERHCRVSLAGDGPAGNPDTPVTFFKEDIDEDHEGLDIALYLSNQVGDARGLKKFNGSNNPGADDKSKYGKLKITSVKLIMNNGIGSNYPMNPNNHEDIGTLRVIAEKKSSSSTTKKVVMNFDINVEMSTDSSEETTILSCSKKISASTPSLMSCYTLRRYERVDYRNYFIDGMGNGTSTQDGLNYSDVVTLHGGCCNGGGSTSVVNDGLIGSPLSESTGDPDDWYGIKCREDNSFFMLSCSHGSAEDSSDNDLLMTGNGCFSGVNDGSRLKNFVDIRCCRYN